MHENLWKLRCFNVCKVMKHWLMIVASCPSLEGGVQDGPQRHPQERARNGTGQMWSPLLHANNHDFITFGRGVHCGTWKQVIHIRCNICLLCHACFSAGPTP